MPPSETLIAFFLATLAFAYLPGPAMLYTAAQTAARGRRAGFMAAFGIHLGGYVHVLAATLGLSALFAHVPVVYAVMKLAGAAYLVWIGLGLLWHREAAETPATVDRSASRALVESVVVEVLNPKVALFFVAFLPQFVDPGTGLPVALQFLILGTIVNLTFTSADIVCVVAASGVLRRLRRGGAAVRWTRRVDGGLLIGLGVRLALDRS